MTSSPTSEPAESEAAYDGFAETYRDWWAPVIAPSAIRLLDRLDGLLPADHPATVVDIGTGTGTVALEALRRWPRLQVIGVDVARRLLDFAERAATDGGLDDRLTVRVGDAAQLPMPDTSVDGAVTTFVIQLVPSRIAALREAFRVVRPGGVFACLTWRADEDPFEPDDVFDDALDALRIIPPERSTNGDRAYTSPSAAAAEVRHAGFRDVHAREEWLEHRFTARSYVDLLERWIEDDTFDSLDEPMRRRLRTETERRLGRLRPDSLVWRRPLVSVVGFRP
jgi:SAM-dependent methyltransferase